MLGLLSAITAVSASNAPSISAAYSTVVDMHISEIMPLFLSDELNPEWSPTLESHQQIYTRDQGYLAHQQYKMPWPMAPRDVLLSCERKANAREGVLLRLLVRLRRLRVWQGYDKCDCTKTALNVVFSTRFSISTIARAGLERAL